MTQARTDADNKASARWLAQNILRDCDYMDVIDAIDDIDEHDAKDILEYIRTATVHIK